MYISQVVNNDPTMRQNRETYFSETIPNLLIHKNDMGCIGGDWNSIENAADATKKSLTKSLFISQKAC